MLEVRRGTKLNFDNFLDGMWLWVCLAGKEIDDGENKRGELLALRAERF